MTLLTEGEARGKWCPFGPTHHVPGTEGCELDAPKSRSRCVASACMAWRFVDREYYRKTELWSKSRNKRVNSAFGDDAEWRPVSGNKDDPPPPAVGYCGLAGRPP